MNVLLDLRCLSQPKTGIQIVAANLLTELLEGPLGDQLQILAGENGVPHFQLADRRIIRSGIAPYDFRRQREIAAIMNASSADIVLSPTYFMPFGVRKPYIITVHDLIPRKVWLGAPSLYVWGLLGSRMRGAHAVWTVSEYSRREILRHYPGLRAKLHVVPSGYVTPLAAPECEKEERSLLLFASKFRHKNADFALRIFAHLQELSANGWKLHVVGHSSALGDAAQSGITVHGRVSDDDLGRLYQKCWGVLLPSIEEGFSLPLLEGMSRGCLVFFHRNTAMQETAGPGGIGLDLDSPEAWARTILATFDDPNLASRQRQRAIERAGEFTRGRFASALRAALDVSLQSPSSREGAAQLIPCP